MAATPAISAQRSRLENTIRWRADTRSLSAPPSRVSRARGTAWQARTTPRARLEWVSVRVIQAKATVLNPSPRSEKDWAVHRLRKEGVRRGARREGRSAGGTGGVAV